MHPRTTRTNRRSREREFVLHVFGADRSFAYRVRMNSRLPSLLAFAFSSLLANAASADVPPSPGYVETCTVANQGGPGRECRSCDTYHGNPPDYCEGLVGAGGFTRACRTSGASVWSEVWCKGVAAVPPPTPAPAPVAAATPAAENREDDGCSVANGAVGTNAALWMALAAWLVSRAPSASRRRRG